MLTRWLRAGALVGVYLAAAGVAWLGSVAWRARALEDAVRHSSAFEGRLVQNDTVYGYRPIPGARGLERRPAGGIAVAVAFDDLGLRTPEPWVAAATGPSRLLALGCSFTFGHLVAAEEAWPEVAGRALGAEVRNGGVCGWGLSQILLRARDLIPRLRPQIVVLQHSKWLAERAVDVFAPSQPGLAAAPYFIPGGEEFVLQPPAFRSRALDLDTTSLSKQDGSSLSRAAFFWRFALPLLANDDLVRIRIPIGLRTGWIPRPAPDPRRVERYVQREVLALTRGVGGRLVVVSMSYGEPVAPPAPIDGVTYVDAQAELYARLPTRDQDSFARKYQHWGNGYLVDRHPNAEAHRIIGAAVARAIATP